MKNRLLVAAMGLAVFGAGIVCGRFVLSPAPAAAPAEAAGAKAREPTRKAAPHPSMRVHAGGGASEVKRLSDALEAQRQKADAIEKDLERLAVMTHRGEWLKRTTKDGRLALRPGVFGMTYDLQPTQGLLDYLGLDEARASEIRNVCEESMRRIADWEKTNARIVGQEESTISYEVPPMGPEEQSRFAANLARVLDADDAALLLRLSDHVFHGCTNTTVITTTVAARPDGGTIYSLRYEMRNKDGGRVTGGSLEGWTPGEGRLLRWRHLIKIEGAAGGE